MASRSIGKKPIRSKKTAPLAVTIPPAPPPTGPRKSRVVLGVFLLALALLGALIFLLGPPSDRPFKVTLVSRVSGKLQACGTFDAWGATAPDGDLLVVSDHGGRLLWFDRSGRLIRTVGRKGKGPEDFLEPGGITSDPSGNIYMVDPAKSDVRGYTKNGHRIADFPLPQGFYGPRGVTWHDQNLWFADTGTQRVVQVSLAGAAVTAWGKSGDGKVEFFNPRTIAFDDKGRMYVADEENSRVQVLSPAGEYLRSIKPYGKASGVAISPKGRVFISSMMGNFIKAYSPEVKYLGTLTVGGLQNALGGVSGITFTPDGLLMTANGDDVSLYRLTDQ